MLATAKNLTINTPRTSCIYFLPKIHKPNLPGQSIVSARSCSPNSFQLFRQNYGTYVKTLLSYIKDSQHALEVFRDFNFLGQNKLIFTMDISSLYSHSQQWRSRGPQIFFDQRIVEEPSSETLLRLTELVLVLNYFSLDGN